MNLAYPWLLALPILLGVLLLIRRAPRRSVPFSSSSILDSLPVTPRVWLRTPLLLSLLMLAVTLLSIAAARPQKITVVDQEKLGRSIVLVIDASRSMLAEDFPTSLGDVSRMEGIKTVVSEYVHTRLQDRIGLVVFGNSAYLQSPLTYDTSLVEQLVKDLRPGMAGDGTAIGDGLGLGLKLLTGVESGSKAVILMTDGVNNVGRVNPVKAAKIASDLGIPVHTIGIGTGDASLNDPGMTDFFGIPLGGQRAEFDEATLKEIASSTGGVYFNAKSLDRLKEVYAEIDTLTETKHDENAQTIIEERFVPFASAATVVLMLLLVLASTWLLKVP